MFFSQDLGKGNTLHLPPGTLAWEYIYSNSEGGFFEITFLEKLRKVSPLKNFKKILKEHEALLGSCVVCKYSEPSF